MSVLACQFALFASLLLLQDRSPIAPAAARPTVLSGRISNVDDMPVAAARVILHPLLPPLLRDLPFGQSALSPPSIRLPSLSTETSADGIFILADVDPRTPAVLSVHTRESLLQTRVLQSPDDFRPSAFPLHWVIPRGRRLTGSVVDADTYLPIAGATIHARQKSLLMSELDESFFRNGALFNDDEGATVWSAPPWLAELLSQGAVLDEPRSITTTITDATGAFSVRYTPADLFEDLQIRVQAPGYAEGLTAISISSDSPPEHAGQLRLRKSVRTRIRVLDDQRQPLAKAIVRFAFAHETSSASSGGKPEEGVVDRTSAAEDKGTAQDKGTPEQKRTADEADASGRKRTEKNLDAETVVFLEELDDLTLSPLPLSAERRTDDRGEIEAHLPPTAAAWIAVRGEGRADWTTARIADRTGAFELVVPPPHSLEVALESANGDSIDGEVACAILPNLGICSGLDQTLPLLAPDVLPPGVVPTRSGTARIDGLSSGEHWIFARAPGHALAGATVHTLLPSEKVTLRLQPLRRRTIQVLGRVDPRLDALVDEIASGSPGGPGRRPTEGSVPGGAAPRVDRSSATGTDRPLAGVRVDWESEFDGDASERAGTLPRKGHAVTDRDGRIELLQIAGASLALRVEHPDFPPRRFEVASLEDEAKVVLGSGGHLSGKIHRSGKPVTIPYRVLLRNAADPPSPDVDLSAVAAPPDGRFLLRGIEPGSYHVRVEIEGLVHPLDPAEARFLSAQREVVLAEGVIEQLDIDITLPTLPTDPEFARVRGTVRGERANAPLEVWLDGPRGVKGLKREDRFHWTVLDRDGDFDLGYHAPGKYLFNVRFDVIGKSYADVAEREIVLAPRAEEHIELDLDLGGPVRGIVVEGPTSSNPGAPIEDASVRLCSRNGADPADPMSFRFDDGLATKADGVFTWSAVPAGTHWLRVFAKDRAWQYLRVQLAPGEPLDLGRIALEEGPLVAGRVVESAAGVARCLRFEYTNPPADRPPRFWLTFDAAHALVDAESGAFSTRELAPGRYVVRLEEKEKDLLPFRPLEIEVRSGGSPNLELRFEPD